MSVLLKKRGWCENAPPLFPLKDPLVIIMKICMRMAWVVVCCFSVFWVATVNARETMAVPGWAAGQSWIVAASYPDLVEEGAWSAPVRWQYRVVADPENTAGETFLLEISRAETESPPVAIVRLRRENLAPVSLETRSRRLGKTLSILAEFEALRPLVTQGSMAPVDLPIFPIVEGAADAYQVSRTVAGDLIRKREMIVRTSAEDAFSSGIGLSDAVDYLKVTVAYDDGTPIFTQYWRRGALWPSYGENESMRYWLVEDEEN